MQKLKLYIFPQVFLWIGVFLLITGLLSGYFYFSGERPEIFDFDVYAFYSTKLRIKYFTIINNNVLDEFAGVVSLLGLFTMFFSKTKHEDSNVTILRIKSIYQGMIISTVFAMLLFVFVYGWPIFAVLACLFYFFLLVCFIVFRLKYMIYLKK
ncbi:MAG: hypothetical protein PF436_01980 [Prolixibacteraceae bacterium]|nr:hypothetical protein [Prolixibacteraceae bacterium]